MDKATSMETPSSKAATDENFPVGSWLLPARLRPHIATFYAYARAIDDIADNPHLEPADKIERLDGFAKAVSGVDTTDPAFRKAHDIRRSLTATQVTHRHCIDLTRAFKLDATKLRYHDWDDLIGYCNLSAAPVGRYLVDLHGESATTYPACDALCNALQVLNHLQDCQDDYEKLNRVYLPQNWMTEAGIGAEVLSDKRSTTALRRVLDRCLEATDDLLTLVDHLPDRFRNLRFAMETAVIVAIAKKLSAELRRRDPLAERVVLTKMQLRTVAHAELGKSCSDGPCAEAIRRQHFPRTSNSAPGTRMWCRPVDLSANRWRPPHLMRRPNMQTEDIHYALDDSRDADEETGYNAHALYRTQKWIEASAPANIVENGVPQPRPG